MAQPHPDLADWIEGSDVIVDLLETSITPVSFGAYDRDDAHVALLLTSPDYQGRGLAGRLLERFTDVAREDERESLSAFAPRNTEAFFKHHGFRPDRQVACGGLDGTRMHRSLP